MITIQDIENVKTAIELNVLAEQAALERNCELDPGLTYEEAPLFFEEKGGNGANAMWELSALLTAAKTRACELEG